MHATTNNFFKSDRNGDIDMLSEDAGSASGLTQRTNMVLAGGSLSILRRKKAKDVHYTVGQLRKMLSTDI